MAGPEVTAMAARVLIPPYELLDLPDGGAVALDIVKWETGTMIIHPKYAGAPAEKEIDALRVYVREGTKPYPPMYHDITSKTLMAQMIPMLEERGFDAYIYRVVKYGVAPKARFTVERHPK
jgi:hypothetical protein